MIQAERLCWTKAPPLLFWKVVQHQFCSSLPLGAGFERFLYKITAAPEVVLSPYKHPQMNKQTRKQAGLFLKVASASPPEVWKWLSILKWHSVLFLLGPVPHGILHILSSTYQILAGHSSLPQTLDTLSNDWISSPSVNCMMEKRKE